MRIDIETNKSVEVLAKKKAKKLQLLSDKMNDDVLDLFCGIAEKATTPKEIEIFNQKVLKKSLLIRGAFL